VFDPTEIALIDAGALSELGLRPAEVLAHPLDVCAKVKRHDAHYGVLPKAVKSLPGCHMGYRP
jgi:hypothetical protein